MMERDGSLDDASCIARLADDHLLKARQNVSMLTINCAGALLAQFISLKVVPGGVPDSGGSASAPERAVNNPLGVACDGTQKGTPGSVELQLGGRGHEL